MKHWEIEGYFYCLLKAGHWRAKTAKSTSSSYMFLFAIILKKPSSAMYHNLVDPEIEALSQALRYLACANVFGILGIGGCDAPPPNLYEDLSQHPI